MTTTNIFSLKAADETIAFVADFWRFAGRKGFGAFSLALCSALLEVVGLLAVIPLLSLVSGSRPNPQSGWIVGVADRILDDISPGSFLSRLEIVVLVFCVIAILRSVLLAWRQNVGLELRLGFLSEIQLRVVRALAAAPWERIARVQHARINYMLGSDIYQVGQAGVDLVESAVALIIIGVQCLLAIALSPAMTLFCAILLLAGTFAMLPLLKSGHDLGEASSGAHLAVMHNTGQFLGALKLAAGQDLRDGFMREFATSLQQFNGEALMFARRQGANRVTVTIVGAVIAAAAGLIGAGVFHISAIVLVTLLLIFLRIGGPVIQLQHHAVELVQSVPAYKKLKVLEAELLPIPGAISGRRSAALSFEYDIVFDGVSYHHRADGNGQAAISGVHGLNVVINRGDFLGVTGASGSGKTTFADLLVGLLGPEQGTIFVDGRMSDLVASPSWRMHISYISQDAFMFNDSIRRCLLWGTAVEDDGEIWDALSVSGADAIVRHLPDGLDTILGERGALISGGERQRFAISRALLRRPRLLVLDEATSAIDPSAEQTILAQLNALRPALTIVHVAHRLESLSLCNRVLLFDNGRISEEVSHQNPPAQLGGDERCDGLRAAKSV
jgi:ATP-binding cassette, subfamily C, bacterial